MQTVIDDRYPTRQSADVELLDRHDPVVWGTADGGPLSHRQLADYDTAGFHVEESLLGESDVADCLAEMTRLAEDEELRHDDRLIRENGDGEVRSIFEVHLLSTVVFDIMRRPAVLDVARQILGSEVYIHQSRINYKPGFDGGPFYWHSDFETWHAEDGMPAPRALSVSIALTPNRVYNGSLMIMPGSHRTFVTCVGSTPKDHFRKSLSSHTPQVGMPDRRSLGRLAERHGIHLFTGAAGGATFFDANCMHGSNGNITPFPRSNLFVVFNSVENTTVEPFAAESRRPPFIASRDFTPVTRSGS
ncbi:ectoine hydroxylase [Nocardia transvalensis]|uniref:ectoine hydroxylase n=1 Tax=Nocardia transvalensis TaxID=37333 RepID=UPI0018930988|nr:ectoine hydroxylase [Nocardia transvalensis]MBF6330371.1 ectoine hydroxylase [Nocardia transvalensis]